MSKSSRERAAEGQRAQSAREPEHAAEAQRSAPRAPAGGAVQLSRLAGTSSVQAARAARQLQRRQGNAAVARAANQPRQAAPLVQAKLVVTAPGDRYEQEADRAAAHLSSAGPASVQRAPLSQIGPGTAGNTSMPVPAELEAGIQAARGRGQPLPEGLRGQMEGALGADFGGVRVHTGPAAHALNESLQARAFTTGRDIFFRAGEYQPVSAGGREVLAHELAHVVQQSGGRNFRQTDRDAAQRQETFDTPSRKPSVLSSVAAAGTKFLQCMRPGESLPDLLSATKSRFRMLANYTQDVAAEASGLAALKEIIEQKEGIRKIVERYGSSADEIKQAKKYMEIVLETENPVDLNDVEERSSKKTDQKAVKFVIKLTIANVRERLVMRKSVQVVEMNPDTEAEKFLEEHKNVYILRRSMSAEEQRNFTTALKNMPTVKSLLAGKLASSGNQWKNKTEMQISYAESDNSAWKMFDEDRNQLQERIRISNAIVFGLAERSILANILAPKIVVYPKKIMTPANPNGFRPKSYKNQILLPIDASIEAIVHEIGHYLEHNLNTAWYGIRKLIEFRQLTAGGDGFALRSSEDPEKGRYPGEYPATGEYTSVTYEEGSTELMSMTLQYMTRATSFKSLLEKDPQQAALILRSIRPQEYYSIPALKDFEKFLPSDVRVRKQELDRRKQELDRRKQELDRLQEELNRRRQALIPPAIKRT